MMLKARLQSILVGWLALLGAVHASQDHKPECITQAWVRAPDLAPNIILQGDARVKISAECPAVENVLLGLRFKERSFVKALRSRDDVKRLNPQSARFNAWNASPWASTHGRFVNQSVKEAYEETVTNKDLWIVREEERIAFETTQHFDVGTGNYGTLRDAVQDFSILVPSTNFPPVLDFLSRGFRTHGDNEEYRVVEWMYEYFAQISFANATTKEISAGLTAFQPMHNPACGPQGLISATVGLDSESLGIMGGNLAKSPPVTNFSVEISADSGLTFSAGAKNHVVTAVVTRTGFARALSAPLSFSAFVTTDLSPKWAAEYNIPDVNARSFMPTSVLRTTSDGNQWFSSRLSLRPGRVNPSVTVVMPNPTSDEIQANEIVTTTSAPFTVSIDVDDTHVTDFQTYYQTLTNSLTVNLGTDELFDPDDPSTEPHLGRGPQFEDDEEAWVPWKKQRRSPSKIWRSYTGRVPVVVRPASEVTPTQGCLHASTDMSGQAVLSDERGCRRPSLIHYLDEGARGPIFVDRSVVHELLAEDPAERELRAPTLEPVASSPPTGEELVYRYHHHVNPRTPLIYVGETWATKVVNKDQHKV